GISLSSFCMESFASTLLLRSILPLFPYTTLFRSWTNRVRLVRSMWWPASGAAVTSGTAAPTAYRSRRVLRDTPECPASGSVRGGMRIATERQAAPPGSGRNPGPVSAFRHESRTPSRGGRGLRSGHARPRRPAASLLARFLAQSSARPLVHVRAGPRPARRHHGAVRDGPGLVRRLQPRSVAGERQD